MAKKRTFNSFRTGRRLKGKKIKVYNNARIFQSTGVFPPGADPESLQGGYYKSGVPTYPKVSKLPGYGPLHFEGPSFSLFIFVQFSHLEIGQRPYLVSAPGFHSAVEVTRHGRAKYGVYNQIKRYTITHR